MLTKILKSKINNDSRILIFSNYDDSFLRIEEILDINNIAHSRLVGSAG